MSAETQRHARHVTVGEARALWAIPFTAGLVLLLNVALAWRGLGGSWGQPLSALGNIAWFTLLALWPALLYLVVSTTSERWATRGRSAGSKPRARFVASLLAHMTWSAALNGYLFYLLQRNDWPTVVVLAASTVLLALGRSLATLDAPTRWQNALRYLGGAGLLLVGAGALALSLSQYGMRYRPIGMVAVVLGAAFGASGLVLVPLSRRVCYGAAAALGFLSLLAAVPFDPSGRPAAAALTAVGHAATGTHYSETRERKGRPDALVDADAVFAAKSGMPALELESLARFNFLLITTEATRFDETSLADANLGTTPNLAQLAADGAFNFARAYSPSNGTLASMSSMFSLTYPSASEISTWHVSWRGELRPEASTLAEAFSAAGFHTFRVSHNFQNSFVEKMRGLDQGFATSHLEPESTARQGETLDERLATAAIARLRTTKASGRPFFGWLFFGGPHAPYVRHYTDSPGESRLDRYRQEVRFMDAQLGRVLDELRSSGLLDETIVMFAADHGEEFDDHGGAGHLTLFEECLHVPLLLRIPHVVGSRMEKPTSSLYALQWLMAKHAPALQVASKAKMATTVAPVLAATDGAVISETVGHDQVLVALIHDEIKTICDVASEWCDTFDLAADPHEQRPLAPLEPRSVRGYDLFRRYMAVRAKTGRFRTMPGREH